jgi:caa(3)-type oxidase subunit IV
MANPEIAELAAEHDHILPRSLYFGIFGILMVLTIITVAAAYVDLGNLNIIVAIAIALVKATFVSCSSCVIRSAHVGRCRRRCSVADPAVDARARLRQPRLDGGSAHRPRCIARRRGASPRRQKF